MALRLSCDEQTTVASSAVGRPRSRLTHPILTYLPKICVHGMLWGSQSSLSVASSIRFSPSVPWLKPVTTTCALAGLDATDSSRGIWHSSISSLISTITTWSSARSSPCVKLTSDTIAFLSIPAASSVQGKAACTRIRSVGEGGAVRCTAVRTCMSVSMSSSVGESRDNSRRWRSRLRCSSLELITPLSQVSTSPSNTRSTSLLLAILPTFAGCVLMARAGCPTESGLVSRRPATCEAVQKFCLQFCLRRSAVTLSSLDTRTSFSLRSISSCICLKRSMSFWVPPRDGSSGRRPPRLALLAA
mmetsp:Transcript_7738/g.17724  ORF Transcript_7738/g.17724 Transcript_7738/m.17724 type:complete len:302 (-) Transcript_7738:188-1093(-)